MLRIIKKNIIKKLNQIPLKKHESVEDVWLMLERVRFVGELSVCLVLLERIGGGLGLIR